MKFLSKFRDKLFIENSNRLAVLFEQESSIAEWLSIEFKKNPTDVEHICNLLKRLAKVCIEIASSARIMKWTIRKR